MFVSLYVGGGGGFDGVKTGYDSGKCPIRAHVLGIDFCLFSYPAAIGTNSSR